MGATWLGLIPAFAYKAWFDCFNPSINIKSRVREYNKKRELEKEEEAVATVEATLSMDTKEKKRRERFISQGRGETMMDLTVPLKDLLSGAENLFRNQNILRGSLKAAQKFKSSLNRIRESKGKDESELES